jgi:hypothetical protein
MSHGSWVMGHRPRVADVKFRIEGLGAGFRVKG